jgi:EAL domain
MSLPTTASGRIVLTVVALGNNLGLATTAEGVETSEQLKVLRRLGCALAQGNLFARPMAAAELTVPHAARFRRPSLAGRERRPRGVAARRPPRPLLRRLLLGADAVDVRRGHGRGRHVVFQLAEVAVPGHCSPTSCAGSMGCGYDRRHFRHEDRWR